MDKEREENRQMLVNKTVLQINDKRREFQMERVHKYLEIQNRYSKDQESAEILYEATVELIELEQKQSKEWEKFINEL